VVGDNLKCPFHGWTFSGETGECVHIPYNETIPKNANTRSWKTIERIGAIFIWYHAENAEPHWFPPSIDGIDKVSRLRLHAKAHFEIRAHIQEIAENGADITHLPILHHQTSFLYPNIIMKHFHHSWEAHWKPSTTERHQAQITVYTAFNFLNFKVGSTAKASVCQIGPGIVLHELQTIFGTYFVRETTTPIGPLHQKLVVNFWGNRWTPRFLAKIIAFTTIEMIERDIPIWNSKKYLPSPLLVKNDGKIMQYRRWFNQFYSEHSVAFEDAQKRYTKLDW